MLQRSVVASDGLRAAGSIGRSWGERVFGRGGVAGPRLVCVVSSTALCCIVSVPIRESV